MLAQVLVIGAHWARLQGGERVDGAYWRSWNVCSAAFSLPSYSSSSFICGKAGRYIFRSLSYWPAVELETGVCLLH
ncbi:Uncharacterised protein [Mycobacteroides abscessus subsp. abscessus]|nr:Uncharacterised protein [Mycobacteroides abscessus subsp. abscessus]